MHCIALGGGHDDDVVVDDDINDGNHTGEADFFVQCCKTFARPEQVGIILEHQLPACFKSSLAPCNVPTLFGLPMKNPDYPFYLNWGQAFEAQECLYDF